MIAIRPMAEQDLRFVVDAWARSFQFSNSAGMISGETWFSVMIPEIERVLARPDAQTFVAFEPSDDTKLSDLYGFLSFDRSNATMPVVFYTYVKEAYRRSGVARRLFAAAGIDPVRPFMYTCSTATVSRIYHAQKIPMAKWSPLIARFAQDDERRPRSSR